jgi:hypothetical protein
MAKTCRNRSSLRNYCQRSLLGFCLPLLFPKTYFVAPAMERPTDTLFGYADSHGSVWHYRNYHRRCKRGPEMVDCRSAHRFGHAIARWSA